MKLKAFKIENYRSIVNTDWTIMAPDNITTLIGQNESGKTSILEGLNSFYNGMITEDIMRSDMAMPMVACEFELSKSVRQKILNNTNLHEKILARIKSKSSIILRRKWFNKNESILFYGDDEIIGELERTKQENKDIEEELMLKAQKIIEDTSKLVEDTNNEESSAIELKSKLSSIESKVARLERIIKRSSNQKKTENAKKELEPLKKEYAHLKLNFDKIDQSFKKNNEKLNILIKKSDYADRFTISRNHYYELVSKYTEIKEKRNSILEKLNFISDGKLSQSLKNELKNYKDILREKKIEIEEKNSDFQFARECFLISVTGNNGIVKDIEAKAWEKVDAETSEHMLEDAGKILFEYIPEFTLFEDFSSLLPNRIDLEEILDENEKAEGYNAARNFLIVSGLDARFFRESNNRILKQKIENLNGEITFDFQGYWRQNLGKNNKIKINFELEHYDFSDPDKKGQPYLEFWIKDEHERLYPKQRSRGVRWFLSFYLELKATALKKDKKGKVLLIDEPGLSLHARAQEDVLAVFEDLKENIQIVYSTHSPHLVNTDKIYRLLAVQRADAFDERSETKVFNAKELANASGDTLSPIYTMLGSQISESNFIRERNNVILEDTSVFYYIKTLFDIFEPDQEIYFLPSTKTSAIPAIANLLTGWKLKYGILMTNNVESEKAYAYLKENIFSGNHDELIKKVNILKDLEGIENIFSTIDFKKYVLQKRIGITETNLEYIENNNLNRTDTASAFALYCQNNPLTPEDFDDESREAIANLVKKIIKLID